MRKALDLPHSTAKKKKKKKWVGDEGPHHLMIFFPKLKHKMVYSYSYLFVFNAV
jgi:hypothetical protein